MKAPWTLAFLAGAALLSAAIVFRFEARVLKKEIINQSVKLPNAKNKSISLILTMDNTTYAFHSTEWKTQVRPGFKAFRRSLYQQTSHIMVLFKKSNLVFLCS